MFNATRRVGTSRCLHLCGPDPGVGVVISTCHLKWQLFHKSKLLYPIQEAQRQLISPTEIPGSSPYISESYLYPKVSEAHHIMRKYKLLEQLGAGGG